MWKVTTVNNDRFTGGLYSKKREFRFFLPAYLYYLTQKLVGYTDIFKV